MTRGTMETLLAARANEYWNEEGGRQRHRRYVPGEGPPGASYAAQLLPGQRFQRPDWMSPKIWQSVLANMAGERQPQPAPAAPAPEMPEEGSAELPLDIPLPAAPTLRPVDMHVAGPEPTIRTGTALANGQAMRGPMDALSQLLLDLSRRGQGGPAADPQDAWEQKMAEDLAQVNQRAQSAKTPTKAQAHAGNYKKGHIRVAGLSISIENPAGATRSGTDPKGRHWETRMRHHYGYVRGSVGRDKDHVDVFINPQDHDSGTVFVINQNKADGTFDEHKCMLGWRTEEQARTAYLSNYQPGWKGLGSIVQMTTAAFKQWVRSGAPARGRAASRHGQAKEALDKEAFFPAMAAVAPALKGLLAAYLAYQSGNQVAQGVGDIARGVREKDWRAGLAGAIRAGSGAFFALPMLGTAGRSLSGLGQAVRVAKQSNQNLANINPALVKAMQEGQVVAGTRAKNIPGVFGHNIMGDAKQAPLANMRAKDVNFKRTFDETRKQMERERMEQLGHKPGAANTDATTRYQAAPVTRPGGQQSAQTQAKITDADVWARVQKNHNVTLDAQTQQRLQQHLDYLRKEYKQAYQTAGHLYQAGNMVTGGLGSKFNNAMRAPERWLGQKFGPTTSMVGGMGMWMGADMLANKVDPMGSPEGVQEAQQDEQVTQGLNVASEGLHPYLQQYLQSYGQPPSAV